MHIHSLSVSRIAEARQCPLVTPASRPIWRLLLAGLLAASTFSPAASAHVVLTQKVAPAGSYYRAQFAIGHGCQGSPTVRVQVDIPDSVPVARPQPKAGWTLSYETGPLAEPAMVHGKQKTEGIRRVVWTGGPLPDEQFDEFGMMLFLAKPGRLHFRVLQTCESGSNDWSAVEVEGEAKPAFPAPTLDVLPVHQAGEGGHGSGDGGPGHHSHDQRYPPAPSETPVQEHSHAH